MRRRLLGWRGLFWAGCALVGLAFALGVGAERVDAPRDFAYQVFLPRLTSASCGTVPGETYTAIGVTPPPTDRPAEEHADLNLALRGYMPTTELRGLVDYGGTSDGRAPKLFTLFSDNRLPVFPSVSRVFDWNWDCNCRGGSITDPPVSLIGMGVDPGEVLRVPSSDYNIGTQKFRPPLGVQRDTPEDDPNGFEVLVLYASPQRITLKYTREDNVVRGYTLHVENVCTAPDLLSLYQQANANGRAVLPALKAEQGFGHPMGNEIGVVIRDNGTFMDPRSRKDWWPGK